MGGETWEVGSEIADDSARTSVALPAGRTTGEDACATSVVDDRRGRLCHIGVAVGRTLLSAGEGADAGGGGVDELRWDDPAFELPAAEVTERLEVDRVAVAPALTLPLDYAFEFELVEDSDSGALGDLRRNSE